VSKTVIYIGLKNTQKETTFLHRISGPLLRVKKAFFLFMKLCVMRTDFVRTTQTAGGTERLGLFSLEESALACLRQNAAGLSGLLFAASTAGALRSAFPSLLRSLWPLIASLSTVTQFRKKQQRGTNCSKNQTGICDIPSSAGFLSNCMTKLTNKA